MFVREVRRRSGTRIGNQAGRVSICSVFVCEGAGGVLENLPSTEADIVSQHASSLSFLRMTCGRLGFQSGISASFFVFGRS